MTAKMRVIPKRAEAVMRPWIDDPKNFTRQECFDYINAAMKAAYGPECKFDQMLITMLVDQVETYCQCCVQINEKGLLHDYNGSPIVAPWVKLRLDTLPKIVSILGDLGLVPRGRPKQANAPTDGADEFLKEAGF